MTKVQLVVLASALGWLAFARPATAQQPYGPTGGTLGRPAYSPYLNLARRGNPAINYYGLVRPETEARNAYQGLAQQLNQVQQDTAGAVPAGDVPLPPTGYPVRFFDYGNFFRGVPRGSGVGRTGPTSLTSLQRPTAATGNFAPPRPRSR